MLVKEVMSSDPFYVSLEVSLADCAHEMEARDCGFIPVGENDRLVGMVTDRDLALRGVAQGKDPMKTSVRDVMTEKVLYVWEDDPVEKAAESMEKQQVRRLIVLNKDKRMTGILSMGDVARKCHDEELCGEIVEAVSEERH